MRQIRTFMINNNKFSPHYLVMYSYATLEWLAQQHRQQILERKERKSGEHSNSEWLLWRAKKTFTSEWKMISFFMVGDWHVCVFVCESSAKIYPFHCNRAIVVFCVRLLRMLSAAFLLPRCIAYFVSTYFCCCCCIAQWKCAFECDCGGGDGGRNPIMKSF